MPATWRVVELASAGKHPDRENEDRLVIEPNHDEASIAGVVDGASLGAGMYGSKSSGALAADRVAQSLQTLPQLSPTEAVQRVVADLASLRTEWNVGAGDLLPPSAAAALVSGDVLWRVGDIHIALRRGDDWQLHPADKTVDQIFAAARAALLRFRLAQGVTVDELLNEDPARPVIAPLLHEQNAVANLDDEANPLAFGGLNGTRVPPRFIERFDVGEGIDEIVLASDGYLSAAPTLAAAEAELQASLQDDPLRIGEHSSTKATPPGGLSFDDRTYLRVARR